MIIDRSNHHHHNNNKSSRQGLILGIHLEIILGLKRKLTIYKKTLSLDNDTHHLSPFFFLYSSQHQQQTQTQDGWPHPPQPRRTARAPPPR